MLTAETEEGLKRGHRRASSVVTEDELVEVDLQVLGAHAAVGAAEPALEVQDRPVRPRQDGVGVGVAFGFGLAARAVAEALAHQFRVALPAVGVHDRSRRHGPFDESGQSCRGRVVDQLDAYAP